MASQSTVETLFSLSGKVALVTGASSGIGRTMAEALAGAGAAVVLVARRKSALRSTAETITAQGGESAIVCADLTVREQLIETAKQCRQAFDTVDILVNAAGANLREPIDEISFASWDQTLNLNLAAPFFFAREFVPGMRERGYGRIINIASLQSSRAFANGLAYGASKAGVCQLTRAMAEAWSRYGIMCNAIAPGFFPTELTAPIFSNPEAERWAAAQTTMGRNGRLEDLAGITVFFAAPASNYITGQTLHIDGGFTAK